jgi:hypothetical protein
MLGAALWCGASARADLQVDGDRLKVATSNIRLVFQGGEIAEITNRLTGERVSYGLQRKDPLTAMLQADGRPAPLRSDGWRRGHDNAEGREAAQTVLRDMTHTVWLNVVLDKENDDVVVAAWGESSRPGVSGYRLAVRSLDLSAGSLIVPTCTGLDYRRTDARTSLRLEYPSRWLAQMLVWQCAEGGVVFYSRDREAAFKAVTLMRRGDYADVGLETRANGPWVKQTSAPHAEWRINAYKGSWQVPAAGYRALMGFLSPRPAVPESRLWPSQITAVEPVPEAADGKWLADVAARRPPARTLLLMEKWAEGGPPDYRMSDEASSFLARAHERGFYVMVSVRCDRARRDWPGLSALRGAEMRPSGTGGASDNGTVLMHPGSTAWRRALIAQLRETLGGERPDALLLLGGTYAPDEADADSGRNGLEGSLALLKEIQAAFPDLVLATEDVNERVLPLTRLARRLPAGDATAHALTSFLFGPALVWF